MRRSGNGFTLIDIVIILAVFGVLLGTMIPLSIKMVQKRRELQAMDEMEKLRVAITGNALIVLNEARTQFGYVGDMGNLPSSLEDLYKKGSQPAYSFDTTKKTGAGWDGPYIAPEIVEHLETLKTDAFGNDYVYTTTPFEDSTTGATVDGKITSKGRDGTADTSDDLSLDFFESQIKSKVVGLIKDEAGAGAGGLAVTMNYPASGTLTTTSTTTDAIGLYTFDDVPYGNRSITIEASQLVFAAGSASITGVESNNIQFSVTNFSSSTISITSFKAVYSSAPPGYYKTLIIGGNTVHDTDTPRLGTGDTKTFSAITIGGGTGVTESIPIRVQSPVTTVGDIPLGTLGRGQTIQIQMNNFKSSPTGGGSDINMTGVPMEVTFSDGSVVRFTPI